MDLSLSLSAAESFFATRKEGFFARITRATVSRRDFDFPFFFPSTPQPASAEVHRAQRSRRTKYDEFDKIAEMRCEPCKHSFTRKRDRTLRAQRRPYGINFSPLFSSPSLFSPLWAFPICSSLVSSNGGIWFLGARVVTFLIQLLRV